MNQTAKICTKQTTDDLHYVVTLSDRKAKFSGTFDKCLEYAKQDGFGCREIVIAQMDEFNFKTKLWVGRDDNSGGETKHASHRVVITHADGSEEEIKQGNLTDCLAVYKNTVPELNPRIEEISA